MSLETTTLGAGCFWCVEAVYQDLRGVASAVSGYMGGALEHPTYEAVCSGQTGHAEVVQLQFDPEVISFDDVLYIFWRTHDPTTLNRQGADSRHPVPLGDFLSQSRAASGGCRLQSHCGRERPVGRSDCDRDRAR